MEEGRALPVRLSGDRDAIGHLTSQDWTKIVAVTQRCRDVGDRAVRASRERLAGHTRRIRDSTAPGARTSYTSADARAIDVSPRSRVQDIHRDGRRAGVRARVQPEGVQADPLPSKSSVRASPPPTKSGGAPVLMREPKVFFVDDHAGKPIGINLFVGKRPSAAFGATRDGDRADARVGDGRARAAHYGLLVLHDDQVREYAYAARRFPAGCAQGRHLSPRRCWTRRESRGWTIVSMKSAWKRIFSFSQVTDAPRAQSAAGPLVLHGFHDGVEVVGRGRLQGRELLERHQVLRPELLADREHVPVVQIGSWTGWRGRRRRSARSSDRGRPPARTGRA